MKIVYIGRILRAMSILEIILYSIVGAILVGFLFKWFIYDKFIKPKKASKKVKIPEEEQEDE